MAKPSSYSVAPGNAGNSRILSWGALVSVVVLAVVSMVLVFPKSDLLSKLRDSDGDTNRDLTLAYLRNIVRTEPQDLGLRLLLAEKLLAENDLSGARVVLDEARSLASRSPKAQTDWDRADLNWWQARLRQAQSRDKPADTTLAAGELMARLKRRVASISTPAQIFAALQAARDLRAALGDQAGTVKTDAQTIARDLLLRLPTLPTATATDLTRGATLALADGYFQQAADLYFAARRKTPKRETADQLLQQGVRALLAGGQPLAAWQAAAREALPLPAGDPLYWWLAELALGAAQARDAATQLHHVVPVAAGAAEVAKIVSFEKLQLAWDIFASAADLQAALVVTEAALMTQPQNTVWLERKAQVSEWSGRGPQALATWLSLLKRGASERALANVFRLSPMLYDDDALLVAWLALARQRRLTVEETRKVVAVYEKLGSVDGALGFVRQLPVAQPDADAATKALWQSLEAQLLERAGRPLEAIAVFERMRPDGMSLEDAKRLAQLQLRQGSLELALRALLSARLVEGSFDGDYWSLVADTAYETGNKVVALDALDRLVASGKPVAVQAARAIRLRLDADRVADALTTAAQLYKRLPEDIVVDAWLDAIARQKTPTGLRDLLAALLPEHRRQLERSAAFLDRRAALYTRLGDTVLALQDYRQSLALRPDDVPTRVAYWWLLIDKQDTTALRAELTRFGRIARADPAYGEVVGVAWQLLDEPQLAMALMQPLARERSNDFLWLMNYADLMERTGREAPALRVRRHAWLLAQRAANRPVDREQARQALVAQLRLAASFAGGEQKTRLWRQLGTLLTSPSEDATQKQQARELVSAWLLSEGRFDTAQRWLWQQQAARMAVPGYQELALALSQNDTQQLARLLEQTDPKGGNRFDPQDRLAALRQLDRRGEAATLGSLQALRRAEGPTDDAQQALQDDLLATASRASVQERTRSAGALTRQEIRFDAAIFMTPRLKLTLELNQGRDRTSDTARIAATPAHDRELRVGVATPTPWGDLKAQALVRDALSRVTGLFLQLSRRLNSDTVLQLEAARGERSDESSAMSVAGVRDRLASTLNLRLGDRLDAQASLANSRFRTQTGAVLGQSTDAALTGNWTLRRDYPDVRFQGQIRRSVVRANGQPDAATAFLNPGGGVPGVDFFLGPSSTAVSASLGIGLAEADPAVYSRAWRPWGEIGIETRQTSTGRQTQPLLRLGAKGSLAGRDQLSVNLDVRPGTGGLTGSEGTRELRLQYEMFFDR